jgi:hypothetical protein
MKNTIKMSLAAALAVSALSTSATAGNLEEMIKDVSVSGKMEVEYDWSSTNSGASGAVDETTNEWDLDWDVTAKIPVNDNMTAVFGMEGDTVTDIDTESINDDKGADNLQVTKVYFQYANAGATVMVGKQGIGAPWFDDERANGVKALYAAGPVTLAAAHFTGNNAAPKIAGTATALQNAEISAVAAIGSVGPVNAQLWYANLAGITSVAGNNVSADSYVIKADAKFDMVNVAVSYASADYDTANTSGDSTLNGDADLLKIVASASLDGFTPYVGYGTTGDNQQGAGVDLTGDNDASVNFGTEQLFIDDLDNADAFLIGVTVPMGATTFDISYVDGEYDYEGTNTSGDFNEFLVQADYKMSKNFTIGAHYSTAELDTSATQTQELDAASVSLEYKF